MLIKLYITVSMKGLAENYKGIEFVRISKLPEEQKKTIVLLLPSDKIIKILRDNELLVDCVQFKHYESWYYQQYRKEVQPEKVIEPTKSKSFKLALDQ